MSPEFNFHLKIEAADRLEAHVLRDFLLRIKGITSMVALDPVSGFIDTTPSELKEMQRVDQERREQWYARERTKKQVWETYREKGVLPDTLGPRIAFYRRKMGMKQTVLAEKIGISASEMCRVENGTRSLGKRGGLRIIAAAAALDLPVSHAVELMEMGGFLPKPQTQAS